METQPSKEVLSATCQITQVLIVLRDDPHSFSDGTVPHTIVFGRLNISQNIWLCPTEKEKQEHVPYIFSSSPCMLWPSNICSHLQIFLERGMDSLSSLHIAHDFFEDLFGVTNAHEAATKGPYRSVLERVHYAWMC